MWNLLTLWKHKKSKKKNREVQVMEVVISDIPMTIIRKDIRNFYIRIKPSGGEVVVTIPYDAHEKAIMKFIYGRIPWIRAKQEAIRNKAVLRYTYSSGETHYVWGKEYTLELLSPSEQEEKAQGVVFYKQVGCCEEKQRLYVLVDAEATMEEKSDLLKEWYRFQLETRLPAVTEKWEEVIGEYATEWRVRNMRTKWGSCNTSDRRIWINLHLAKKDPRCLDMVVVHELLHFIERGHNERFYGYMDQFYPTWREVNKLL